MPIDAFQGVAREAAIGVFAGLVANRATKRGWPGEAVVGASVVALLIVAGLLRLPALSAAWVPWLMIGAGVVGWVLILWRMEWRPRSLAARRGVDATSPAYVMPPSLAARFSMDEVSVRMSNPLYDPQGAFVADLRFSNQIPFPNNAKLKSLVVEARSGGRILGQYRYIGSRIPLVGRDARIGKAIVLIKDDAFRAWTSGEATRTHHWEVQVDARVVCEFFIPGEADTGPLEFHVEPQFCGVRLSGFTEADVAGALPRDMS